MIEAKAHPDGEELCVLVRRHPSEEVLLVTSISFPPMRKLKFYGEDGRVKPRPGCTEESMR